jgi:hypothetical protein
MQWQKCSRLRKDHWEIGELKISWEKELATAEQLLVDGWQTIVKSVVKYVTKFHLIFYIRQLLLFFNAIGAEEEIGSSVRWQRPADLPDAGHSHRLITSRMAPGEHDQLWVVAKQSPRCQSISLINCYHYL